MRGRHSPEWKLVEEGAGGKWLAPKLLLSMQPKIVETVSSVITAPEIQHTIHLLELIIQRCYSFLQPAGSKSTMVCRSLTSVSLSHSPSTLSPSLF